MTKFGYTLMSEQNSARDAELHTPQAFSDANQYVRPEDVAAKIACGAGIEAIVAAVRVYREAGFTDIALNQIGGQAQASFLSEAAPEVLAALRADDC